MKTTSCGILLMSPAAELLLCHATGTPHWDIPKGAQDPGESCVDTALRETREECGVLLEAADLLDVGHFGYRPHKDLRLYAALIEAIDPRRCHCSTHFRDRFDRLRPEMDAFAWTRFAEVPARCAKSMAVLLTDSVSLPALLERLAASGPVRRPAFAPAPQR